MQHAHHNLQHLYRFIALVGLHGHGKSSILKMFGGELLPGEGVQNALPGQAGIGHLALIDSQSLAFGVPCGTSHCAVLEGRPGISRHWIQVKCLGYSMSRSWQETCLVSSFRRTFGRWSSIVKAINHYTSLYRYIWVIVNLSWYVGNLTNLTNLTEVLHVGTEPGLFHGTLYDNLIFGVADGGKACLKFWRSSSPAALTSLHTQMINMSRLFTRSLNKRLT